MAMSKWGGGHASRMKRNEALGWAEGLWLVVVGEKLRLHQQFLLPPPFLWGLFPSCPVVPSWFFWAVCKCQPSYSVKRV